MPLFTSLQNRTLQAASRCPVSWGGAWQIGARKSRGEARRENCARERLLHQSSLLSSLRQCLALRPNNVNAWKMLRRSGKGGGGAILACVQPPSPLSEGRGGCTQARAILGLTSFTFSLITIRLCARQRPHHARKI